jgi:chromosome partitioning protein
VNNQSPEPLVFPPDAGDQAVMGINDLVTAHASKLSAMLHQHRSHLFPPNARKQLRRFTSGEVADLLGVTDAYLRKLSREGKGPQPETGAGGRRLYTAENIMELRHTLEGGVKTPGTYLPWRRDGDPLQVLTVVNLKGGSSKTTTAANLSAYLAIKGYRVLAVDLDPQASLTALYGIQPEMDLGEDGTLYGAIRYEDPMPLRDIIQKTYFVNLDIVPGNLDLMEFEHSTPRALTGLTTIKNKPEHELTSEQREWKIPFFERLSRVLEQVQADYDVVVIDCPPQLGFLTLAALSAATGVLVTVHPQMLDVMSMSQFLIMTSELLNSIGGNGAKLDYDWFRYVITRYEPGDGPQNQMVTFMRALFGEHVLNNTVLKSTAIADAGLTKQTLYEVDRSSFSRSTYDRARESLDSVNGEIEGLIKKVWGR